MCENSLVLYSVLFFVIKTVRTRLFPSMPFLFLISHHLSVTHEKNVINKRKSHDPSLNIVKGKAARFDIFFHRHAFICMMAFTSSDISVVCQLS